MIACSQMFNSNKPKAVLCWEPRIPEAPGAPGRGKRDRHRGEKDGARECVVCVCLAGRVPLRLHCKAIISGGVRDL